MGKLTQLLRTGQWYKNLLIFLPIIFSQQITSMFALEKTFIGLIALCLVSSANYILNDISDKERDLFHPEKKKKLIASGKVKVWHAFLLAAVLLIISFRMAVMLSMQFTYFVLALFLITLAYSLFLKKEAFIDILVISINFVLRAVAGSYVIITLGKPYIWVSPWLIVCTFFLALLLATGKRKSELTILKSNAGKYRPVLKIYTPKIAEALLYISATALIVSYTLYSFLSVNPALIYTGPIALYSIFRYLYLVETGSKIPMKIQTFYKDSRLLISAALWAAGVGIIIYLL